MKWTTFAYLGIGAGTAFAAFVAYHKAQPVPAKNVSAIPWNVPTAQYSIDAGVGGVYPLTTFPDILGTSPNVPMPT